jgi:hypothetical protein
MTTHGIDRSPNQLKYLVLAGNIREFYVWQADNQVRGAEALFVSNSQMLRARKFPPTIEVVMVGTFHLRQDHKEIMDMVKERLEPTS